MKPVQFADLLHATSAACAHSPGVAPHVELSVEKSGVQTS
jgi:hypothetical protein